jgi:hypothetical protein
MAGGGGWRGDERGVRAGQSAGAQAQPGGMRGRPPRGQQALLQTSRNDGTRTLKERKKNSSAEFQNLF